MDTVKTTAYVLKNYLKGYKLLQNPKGTSPNDVTMIKRWFGINPIHYDKYYNYDRIHRYKENNKFVEDKTSLLSSYYMNTETLTYSGKKKNLKGYITKNGIHKSFTKTNVSKSEIINRPNLDFYNEFENSDPMSEKLFKQDEESGYYLHRPGFFVRLFTLGGWREMLGFDIAARPIEPSFWHVLKTNLSGGGIHTKDKEHYNRFWQFMGKIFKD